MRHMTLSPTSRWRRWADLSSHALAGEISQAVVVMPVAATEQHGPHLPLSVDSDLAEGILRLASERWSGTAPVLQLPLQAVGFSAEHLGYAGTLSLSSTRTAAPAARALALGLQEPTNGTAAPTTPATPTTEVDPNKKRLRPESVPSSLTVLSPELGNSKTPYIRKGVES